MCFTNDSYSAILLCEFPALLTCICGERNKSHIKTSFSRLHSLYLCPATHHTPSFHLWRIYIQNIHIDNYKIFMYKKAKIVLVLSLTGRRKT